MRLLQLMILPLVISSLISGAGSLDAKLNGKIALRTVAYFLITSFISAMGRSHNLICIYATNLIFHQMS